jgi:hypothetical protein
MKPSLRPPKRGVLLLVVLSMLTLFLMLGATYLVAASRARRLARAYANACASALNATGMGPQLVDEAFITVVRGTTVTSGSIQPGNDLLGDRYGTAAPAKGTISGAVTGTSILAANVTGLTNPEKLAGRVITFTLSDLAGASTRIIRTTNNAGVVTIYFPAGRTVSGKTLTADVINQAVANTTQGSNHILVNNREFDDSAGNEPYDAYDDKNAYLAKITGTSAIPSYTGGTGQIDNDGDGVADSNWIDIGLPSLVDAAGNILQPKAAILVVDLDGRINVNTHGSNVDLETTEGPSDFGGGGGDSLALYPDELLYAADGTTVTGTIELKKLPRGLGLGPAEIALAATAATGTGGAPGLPSLVSGLPSMQQSDISSEGRPRPTIGQPEGRYGDRPAAMTNAPLLSLAKPGTPSTNDNSALDRWVTASTTTNSYRYFDDVYTRYGSPPDIKGRMRVWVDKFGQPVYFKPAWAYAGFLGTFNGRSWADDETIDDPYEIDLGPTGPRNGWIHDPTTLASGTSAARDNLFSAAELEGVLRFYDPDSLRLQRRLVSLLGSSAADGRLTVTTDSWDTPAIVGTAWSDVIAGQFAAATTSTTGTAGAKPYELFAPETLMGHKLDLNRPFHPFDTFPAYTWEPMDEDANSNGSLDTGEDRNSNAQLDNTGEQLRQQFAKHLYCLLMAIARKNKGSNLTSSEAEQLAQWAVNIVDFRDVDSAMTRFEYDEAFSANSTTWNPTKRVWGCERPEILITETHAWHDRRTDDTAADSTGKEIINADPTTADNDFDQRRRPRGAFFIELYSPWGSQAKQSMYNGAAASKPSDVYRSGTSSPLLRGEPLPSEFTATADDRFDRDATITLRLRHDRSISNADDATASPIWRLVSVRGDVKPAGAAAFGSDGFGDDPGRPFVSGSTSGSLSILDPARSLAASGTLTVGTGTAVMDRIFYFTPPPSAQRAEANGYGQTGCVFWESGTSTKEPSQTSYVVFGTTNLSPTDTTATGTFSNVHRTFNRPANRPATLSEPLATGTATTTSGTSSPDGYQVLTGTAATFPAGTSIYDSNYVLNATLDEPLDGRTSHPSSVTAPFLYVDTDADGSKVSRPVLMNNGRYANFAIVHLQRLADPSRRWQPAESQPFYNPYLTVDSLPVDLTVLNNGTSGSGAAVVSGNLDEPGQTPRDNNGDPVEGTALTWLSKQRAYDRLSIERGGKNVDRDSNTSPEKDVWGSKINVASANLSLTANALFRSGTAALATINNYTAPPTPNPTNQKGSIAKRDVPGNLPSSFGSRPERFTADRQPWLLWPNRPFNSPGELAAVPRTSSFHLLKLHTTGTGSSTVTPAFAHLPGLLESGTAQPPFNYLFTPGATGTAAITLFDFVHVPTRFTGSYVTLPTTTSNTASLAAHGLANQPYNHLSLFREPGRINFNTIQSADIKKALLGKQLFTTPPTWNSGTAAARTWPEVLKAVNPQYVDSSQPQRNADLDSFFRFQTAQRLANTTTTRSNVFAVWVTIGYFTTDNPPAEPDPLRRNRGFFIYDRSIPVGYEPGTNHNARDGVLLRRIIQ